MVEWPAQSLEFHLQNQASGAWGFMPMTPELEKFREKVQKLKVILGYVSSWRPV